MEDVLSIQFPKQVRILNNRLAVLYYLVLGLLVSYVVHTFVQSNSYYTYRNVHGRTDFWASSKTPFAEVNKKDSDKAFCKFSSEYEFCDTADCFWHFSTAKCLDICGPNDSGQCFDPSLRWFKEDNGIFFPMYYNETVHLRATSSMQTSKANQQVFVKGVEEMSIVFDHEYFLQNPDDKRETGFSKDAGVDGDYDDALLTIWVDETGSEIKRWQPGESIALGVGQIFDEVIKSQGIDLNTINTGLGRNTIPGAKYQDGVSTRISGVTVSMSLMYQNHKNHEGDFDLDWEGPICFLRLYASAPWTSKPMTQILDERGSTMQRYFYGIRVKFDSGGSFVWVDGFQIVTLVTNALVFIAVGQQLVFYFAIYCLGPLSKVYRRVLVQPLHLKTEITGIAARLISVSESFRGLQDSTNGISKGRIFKRFKNLFAASSDLDEHEIRKFVTYVLNHISGSKDEVAEQEYANACSANEPLTLEELATFFNAKRKRGIGEALFATKDLQEVTSSTDEGDLGGSSTWASSSDLGSLVSPSDVIVAPETGSAPTPKLSRPDSEQFNDREWMRSEMYKMRSEMAELKEQVSAMAMKQPALKVDPIVGK